MPCYLCQLEGVATNPSGTCVVCNSLVCMRPPSRVDKVFHGEQCQCGCRKTVCERDLVTHAQTQHLSSAPSCFPGLAVYAAVATLGSALVISGDIAGGRGRAKRTIARFLNSVTPGRHALWDARSGLGGEDWQRGSLAGDRQWKHDVLLADSFFSPDRVQQVASLALATLAHGLGATDVSSIRSKMPARRRSALDEIVRRAQMTGSSNILRHLEDANEVLYSADHFAAHLPAADKIVTLPVLPLDFSRPADKDFAVAALGFDTALGAFAT